ncbi:MAG: WD40 repeat domain-containing protein, partial [Acidimicrobiales bacterium]
TSARLRDDEEARTRRTNRRLRRLAVAVSVVALIALVAGVFAVVQQQDAADQRDAAEVAATEADLSRAEAVDQAEAALASEEQAVSARASAETSRMAAESVALAPTNPRLALLLAAEAHAREPSVATLSALQRTMLGTESIVGFLGSPDRQYHDVEWVESDNGSRIIAARRNGIEVYDGDSHDLVWDVPTEPLILTRGARTTAAGELAVFAVSNSAAFAAVATQDDAVAVVDVDSQVSRVLQHDEPVSSLAFNHAEDQLATGDSVGVVRIWDLESASVVQTIVAHPEESQLVFRDAFIEAGGWDLQLIEDANPGASEIARYGVAAMVFSADDAMLITADSPIMRVWDLDSGRKDREFFPMYPSRFAGGVLGGALFEADFDLDPDEPEVIAAATRNELLRVNWVDETVTEVLAVQPDDDTNFTEAGGDLLPDGTWLLGYSDGTAHVLDGEGVRVWSADPSVRGIAAVAASPDGHTAVVAGEGGLVLLGLEGSSLLAEGIPKAPLTGQVAISSDRSLVVQSGFFPGSTVLHEVDAQGQWGPIPAAPEFSESSAWLYSTRDGSQFLDAWYGFDVSVNSIFDPVSAEQRGTLDAGGLGATLSPDGSLWAGEASRIDLGGESAGLSVEVYDTSSWDPIVVLDPLEQETLGGVFIRSTTFDHLSSRLIATTTDGTYGVWDTATWERIDIGVDLGDVLLASFSPDGRFLATVDGDGTITIRDAVTYEEIRRMAGQGPPTFIGSWLGGWSDDGSILLTRFETEPRVWNVESGLQIGDPFPNDGGAILYGATFGLALATPQENHTSVWNTDTSTWAEVACEAVGRNMTQAEWDQFGPQGEPYRATCPQYPPGG